MSIPITELSQRLQQSLDNEYNVIDMCTVLEVISVLEGTQITKEQLETPPRLGRIVNELRRKTSNDQLARRSKNLLKQWRKMVIPTPATAGNNNNNISPAPQPSINTTAAAVVPTAFTSSSSSNNNNNNNNLSSSSNNNSHLIGTTTSLPSSFHGASRGANRPNNNSNTQQEYRFPQQNNNEQPLGNGEFLGRNSSPLAGIALLNSNKNNNNNNSYSEAASSFHQPQHNNHKNNQLQQQQQQPQQQNQPTTFAKILSYCDPCESPSTTMADGVSSKTSSKGGGSIDRRVNSRRSQQSHNQPDNQQYSSFLTNGCPGPTTSGVNAGNVSIDLSDLNSDSSSMISNSALQQKYTTPTKANDIGGGSAYAASDSQSPAISGKQRKHKKEKRRAKQSFTDKTDSSVDLNQITDSKRQQQQQQHFQPLHHEENSFPRTQFPLAHIVSDNSMQGAKDVISIDDDDYLEKSQPQAPLLPSSSSSSQLPTGGNGSSHSDLTLTFSGKFKKSGVTTGAPQKRIKLVQDYDQRPDSRSCSPFNVLDSSNDASQSSHVSFNDNATSSINVADDIGSWDLGAAIDDVELGNSLLGTSGGPPTLNMAAMLLQQQTSVTMPATSVTATNVPKKRGRKKGSKGIDSLLGSKSANNNCQSGRGSKTSVALLSLKNKIESMRGSSKKVKTTKELLAELQNKKGHPVGAAVSPMVSSPLTPLIISNKVIASPSTCSETSQSAPNSIDLRSTTATPVSFRQTATPEPIVVDSTSSEKRRKLDSTTETVDNKNSSSQLPVTTTTAKSRYNAIEDDIMKLRAQLPKIDYTILEKWYAKNEPSAAASVMRNKRNTTTDDTATIVINSDEEFDAELDTDAYVKCTCRVQEVVKPTISGTTSDVTTTTTTTVTTPTSAASKTTPNSFEMSKGGESSSSVKCDTPNERVFQFSDSSVDQHKSIESYPVAVMKSPSPHQTDHHVVSVVLPQSQLPPQPKHQPPALFVKKKPVKSIFDLDYDGDDYLETLASHSRNTERSAEAISNDADLKSQALQQLQQHPSSQPPNSQMPSSEELPPSEVQLPPPPDIPRYEVIEDPLCVAKKCYFTDRNCITKYHVSALHNECVPNVNGNWTQLKTDAIKNGHPPLVITRDVEVFGVDGAEIKVEEHEVPELYERVVPKYDFYRMDRLPKNLKHIDLSPTDREYNDLKLQYLKKKEEEEEEVKNMDEVDVNTIKVDAIKTEYPDETVQCETEPMEQDTPNMDCSGVCENGRTLVVESTNRSDDDIAVKKLNSSETINNNCKNDNIVTISLTDDDDDDIVFVTNAESTNTNTSSGMKLLLKRVSNEFQSLIVEDDAKMNEDATATHLDGDLVQIPPYYDDDGNNFDFDKRRDERDKAYLLGGDFLSGDVGNDDNDDEDEDEDEDEEEEMEVADNNEEADNVENGGVNNCKYKRNNRNERVASNHNNSEDIILAVSSSNVCSSDNNITVDEPNIKNTNSEDDCVVSTHLDKQIACGAAAASEVYNHSLVTQPEAVDDATDSVISLSSGSSPPSSYIIADIDRHSKMLLNHKGEEDEHEKEEVVSSALDSRRVDDNDDDMEEDDEMEDNDDVVNDENYRDQLNDSDAEMNEDDDKDDYTADDNNDEEDDTKANVASIVKQPPPLPLPPLPDANNHLLSSFNNLSESNETGTNSDGNQFKEWYDVVHVRSYNDELLTILPYVVID